MDKVQKPNNSEYNDFLEKHAYINQIASKSRNAITDSGSNYSYSVQGACYESMDEMNTVKVTERRARSSKHVLLLDGNVSFVIIHLPGSLYE
jgi:hypothetical protein